MRTAEFPFLADWFAISLRWLALTGLVAALAREGLFDWRTLAALILVVIWNIAVTILAILNRRLPGHRVVNIAVDLAVAVYLYIVSGGLGGPVAWGGVLALFSTALYFGWGVMITALLYPLLVGAWSYWQDAAGFNPYSLGLMAGVLLAVGFLLGLLSHLLLARLRQAYQRQVMARRDAELQAQLRERARMQTFYSMIETLSATLDYQVVLETSLDLCITALGGAESPAGDMVSTVLLFDEQDLRVGAGRRLPLADLRQIFPAEAGALHTAIQDGEPLLLEKPNQDVELKALYALQSCSIALLLPLRRGLNAFGVLLFAHRDPEFFNEERAEMLVMISHQAVVAIQNARLYQDVELEKERIIETQEEARKKLARDLHDGPTQSVAAIAMRINIARRMLDLSPSEAAEELSKIEDLARRTTQEIRHMLFTLRPLVLESEGLVAALQAMADKMHDTFQQNVVVEADAEVVKQLEMNKQAVIFYLTEEAVNNARKHAQAAQILVRLRFVPQNHDIALLEIIDNGVGFDVNAVNSSYERRGSLGMINLRERTDLINGLLRIDSAPGKGTRISVLIPLTDEAADLLQRGLTKK